MQPDTTLHGARRQWLAAALRGESPAWDTHLGGTEDMLDCAFEEGVAAVVNQEVSARRDMWQLPREFDQGLATATRSEVVSCMLREAEYKRILECLAEANLSALLLKGSALAYWVYDQPWLRPCVDIDLLFASRDDAQKALDTLGKFGYTPVSRAVPGDLIYYELGCFRAVGGTRVWADMHWNIGGSPLFADRFSSDELFAASIPLPKLAANARAIGPIYAYLHNCTHRALELHHGTGDRLKWHYDLHLLARTFSADDWDRLGAFCEQRSLARPCLDAMQTSAALFQTQIPASMVDRLTEATRTEKLDISRMRSWKYVEYMNFRALPTLKQRLRWLRQRALPHRVYLDDMYGGRWVGYGRYLRKGLRKFLGGQS
jgi:hypothetical protein